MTSNLRPQITRRHIIIIIAAVVLTMAAVLSAWLTLRTTYDDTVDQCVEALATHDADKDPVAEGGRVPGCEDVKEDDYGPLVFSNVIDGQGWTDDEGNFDENKLFEDALED